MTNTAVAQSALPHYRTTVLPYYRKWAYRFIKDPDNKWAYTMVHLMIYTKTMITNLTRYEENKLWKYVEKTPSCWIWKGSRRKPGYGQKQFRGKLWQAHRLIYTILKEEIPENKIACHVCDNPPCVNPDHIFIGTHKDNMQDASRKGRLKGNRKPKRRRKGWKATGKYHDAV